MLPFYIGRYKIVSREHLRHTEMVCGEEVTMKCYAVSRLGGCAFKGSGKENYSDISKVCYPRCIRTMDWAH